METGGIVPMSQAKMEVSKETDMYYDAICLFKGQKERLLLVNTFTF